MDSKITQNNTDNKNTNRNYLFDNIKAILIFSVVLAHFLRASSTFEQATFGGELYITSFSFIMQGFFFISGFFSKDPEKCRKGAFKSFLFPYLILMPIMFGIRYMIFDHATLNIIKPTMALWFLLTMFYYRFFLKDLIRVKYILPISIGVSLFAGCFSFLNSYFALGRTFGFLPFFLLGYYCKPEHIDWIRKIPRSVSHVLILILFGFAVYMANYGDLSLSAWYFKSWYGSLDLSFIEGIGIRLLLSIIAMAWIAIFINLVPKEKNLLTGIGQNTLTVYVLHIVVRYLIKDFGWIFEQDMLSYFFLITIAMISTWYFSKQAVVNWYKGLMNGLYGFAQCSLIYAISFFISKKEKIMGQIKALLVR